VSSTAARASSFIDGDAPAAVQRFQIPSAAVTAIGHNGAVVSLPSSSRPTSSRSGAGPSVPFVVGCVSGLVGLLVVVTGTFLPWLTSGGVQRNSYAVLGIVRRLAFLDGGPAATAISLWPLIGTIAMVPVIAGIVRWWRTAAITTLLFGLLTGLGAAAVLAVAGGHEAVGISLSASGPTVTVAGAALAVVGAVLLLLARRRSRPAPAFPGLGNQHVSVEPTDGPFRRTAHSSTFDRSPRHPPHSPHDTAHRNAAVETERENAG
jgi:hypothetical protein